MNKKMLYNAILASFAGEEYFKDENDPGSFLEVEFTKFFVRIKTQDDYVKFRLHDTHLEPLIYDSTCAKMTKYILARFIAKLTQYEIKNS